MIKLSLIIIIAGLLTSGCEKKEFLKPVLAAEKPKKEEIPTKTAPESPHSLKEISLEERRRQAILQRSLSSDIYGRQDPFAPLAGRADKHPVTRGKLELKGILWDESQPLAVINEVVVREGEIVDGRKILRIEKTKVILEEDGKEFILWLRLEDFEKKEEK